MSGPRGRLTLADNLERLFNDVRPDGPEGRRYTNDEVAAAVRRTEPGVRVSGAYLSALRKGTKANPTAALLNALARFFGVPVASLLEEDPAGGAARTDLDRVARNTGVRRLAVRALELSPEGLAAATEVVERFLQNEGRRDGASLRQGPSPPVPRARRADGAGGTGARRRTSR